MPPEFGHKLGSSRFASTVAKINRATVGDCVGPFRREFDVNYLTDLAVLGYLERRYEHPDTCQGRSFHKLKDVPDHINSSKLRRQASLAVRYRSEP
jgi:hypothetical protein